MTWQEKRALLKIAKIARQALMEIHNFYEHPWDYDTEQRGDTKAVIKLGKALAAWQKEKEVRK